MAKKKSRKKQRNKGARQLVQTPEVPVVSRAEEATPEVIKSPQKLKSKDIPSKPDLSIVALIVALLCLVLAGVLIWLSYRVQPVGSNNPIVTPVPLNDRSNPTQLQSGTVPLQNGSSVGALYS